MATSTGEAPTSGLLGGKRIESGRNTYTGINFTEWGTAYAADIPANITFGKAFSSLPVVIATVDGSTNGVSGSIINVKYTNTGITGFGMMRADMRTNAKCTINWLAIGD